MPAYLQVGKSPNAPATVKTLLSARSAYVKTLPPKELMVLGHLAEGRSNKEIATRMGIVVKTVEKHNERIWTRAVARSPWPSLAARA